MIVIITLGKKTFMSLSSFPSLCNLFISSFSSRIWDSRMEHSFDFTSKSIDNLDYKTIRRWKTEWIQTIWFVFWSNSIFIRSIWLSNEHFISSDSFNDRLSRSCNLFIFSFSSMIFDWKVKHSFDFASKSLDNWDYEKIKMVEKLNEYILLCQVINYFSILYLF